MSKKKGFHGWINETTSYRKGGGAGGYNIFENGKYKTSVGVDKFKKMVIAESRFKKDWEDVVLDEDWRVWPQTYDKKYPEKFVKLPFSNYNHDKGMIAKKNAETFNAQMDGEKLMVGSRNFDDGSMMVGIGTEDIDVDDPDFMEMMIGEDGEIEYFTMPTGVNHYQRMYKPKPAHYGKMKTQNETNESAGGDFIRTDGDGKHAETFNADSGFWKMRWVIPVEAYPRHMRTTDNDWAKDFYCDKAWVERHGDEYTLHWIVRAYKPTKVQRPAKSVFSKTYPYTERGWFNGYMKWAQIPMRGKNWSDEVQEKLGAFVGKRAETFNAYQVDLPECCKDTEWIWRQAGLEEDKMVQLWKLQKPVIAKLRKSLKIPADVCLFPFWKDYTSEGWQLAFPYHAIYEESTDLEDMDGVSVGKVSKGLIGELRKVAIPDDLEPHSLDQLLSSRKAETFNADRNQLSEERTELAHQRTKLAWVRTGLAVVGFGVAVWGINKGMNRE
jgi:hypothetical protein